MTGKEIQARRKALGLTQEQLAKRLGTTGNNIARWERENPACPYPGMLTLAFDALDAEASTDADPPLDQLERTIENLREIAERLKGEA